MRYRHLLSLALLSSPALSLTIGPREVWESDLHQRDLSEDQLHQRDLTYLEVRDLYERLALTREVIEAHLSKRGNSLAKVKKPKDPIPILPLARAGSGDLESANRSPSPRPGRPSQLNLNKPSTGAQPPPHLSRPSTSGSGSNIAGPSSSQSRPLPPFRKVPSAPSLNRVSSSASLTGRPAPPGPLPPVGPRPAPPPPKLPPSNNKPKLALNIHGDPLNHKVKYTPPTGIINNSALRQAKSKLTPPKSHEELLKAATAAKVAAGPKPASNGASGSGSGAAAKKSEKDKKKEKAGLAAYMPTAGQLGAVGALAAVGLQGWGNVVSQNGLMAAQQGLQVSQQGLLASQQGLTANVKNQHIAFANAYHGGAISADGRTAFGASGMPNVPLDWDGVGAIGGKAEAPAPGSGSGNGSPKKKKNGGK